MKGYIIKNLYKFLIKSSGGPHTRAVRKFSATRDAQGSEVFDGRHPHNRLCQRRKHSVIYRAIFSSLTSAILALIATIVSVSVKEILRSNPTIVALRADLRDSSAQRQRRPDQRESRFLACSYCKALRANGVRRMPPKLMLSNRAKYFFSMLYTNQANERNLSDSRRPFVTIRYDFVCTNV